MKVDEIDTILKEEITPTLERLRGEKTFYLRWSANKTEEERLQRFCVAYEYSSAEASLTNADEEFQGMERQRATLEQAQEAAAVRGTLPPSPALCSLFYVHCSTFTRLRSLFYVHSSTLNVLRSLSYVHSSTLSRLRPLFYVTSSTLPRLCSLFYVHSSTARLMCDVLSCGSSLLPMKVKRHNKCLGL